MFGSARERFLAAALPKKEETPPDYAALLKLAELLSAPAAFKVRIKELTDATAAAKAETVAARAAVAKLRADTELELAKARKALDATIAAEAAAHAAA
jgi:NH3-dependent NAD+ synthetase